jgi:hypothetical protein
MITLIRKELIPKLAGFEEIISFGKPAFELYKEYVHVLWVLVAVLKLKVYPHRPCCIICMPSRLQQELGTSRGIICPQTAPLFHPQTICDGYI